MRGKLTPPLAYLSYILYVCVLSGQIRLGRRNDLKSHGSNPLRVRAERPRGSGNTFR